MEYDQEEDEDMGYDSSFDYEDHLNMALQLYENDENVVMRDDRKAADIRLEKELRTLDLPNTIFLERGDDNLRIMNLFVNL